MTEQNTEEMVDETTEQTQQAADRVDETAETFSDEVEKAIDNMQIPVQYETVPVTDGMAVAFDPAQVSDEHKAAIHDLANGIRGMRDQQGLDEDGEKAADAISETVQQNKTGMPKQEQPEEIAVDYDAAMQHVKSKPGYDMFSAGFQCCLKTLQQFIDEHKGDDDMMAIIFNDYLNQTPETAFVVQTTEWANRQDVSDGALLPKSESVLGDVADVDDLEKRQLDLAQRTEGFDGQTPKEAATRVDFSAYTREQLEAMLGEQLAIVESLEQAIKRDNATPDLWAAITEYFNTVMTDVPESSLDMPLVNRIMHFTNRLIDNDAAARLAIKILTGEEITSPVVIKLPEFERLLADTKEAAGKYESLQK